MSGDLDPARTVRTAFYDNESTDPYQATEIFGDEVCSVVTESALYRETSFTIFMPSSGPMISRLGGYLSQDDSALDPDVDSIGCPWVYVRRHMSVSFLNPKKFFGSLKDYFSVCLLIMSTMICD